MDNSLFPSHWISVQGLDIHYKCSGKGPAVILLHGAANDWHEWRMNFGFLAQNFRVYALDLPGFGLSTPPAAPISPALVSSFLNNFMKALNITDTHIIGHSLGGIIILTFALEFPEKIKKIVLVDSGGLGQVSRKGQLLLHLTRGIKIIMGKEQSFDFKAGGSMEEWLLINRLHELKSPVMIVWGERDPYYPPSQARLAQSLIPNCQLYIFPHCRHAPHRERPTEFNRLTHQFLVS
jgi:pimeloyl-ACP methyl ester carboxylesterase